MLDAVREDDTAAGHQGLDHDLVLLLDPAGDDGCGRMAADERLADGEEQSRVLPRKLRDRGAASAGERRDARRHVEDRRHPAGRSGAGADDDAARRLRFAAVAGGDAIPGGDVASRADEEIVERQQPLAVAEGHLGERDRPRRRRLAGEQLADHGPGVAGHEREQHAVEPFGIGVDADDRPVAGVLGDVGDEPVLSERDHEIERAERVGRDQAPIDELPRDAEVEVAPEPLERSLIRVVLALVVAEVAARVLDVEARLALGVEAVDELLEARPARDDDELLVAGHGILSGPASSGPRADPA